MKQSNKVKVLVAIIIFVLTGMMILQAAESGPGERQDTGAAEIAQSANEEMLIGLMEKLHTEMTVIRNTRDRKERQRLVASHRDSMREALTMMRGMGSERMQSLLNEHMGAKPEQMPQKTNEPVHRHKQPPVTGKGSPGPAGPSLADLELRLDMMQLILESLTEQYEVP